MSIGVGGVVAGYRLTEPLHAGPNGELFLAEETGSLGRTVVVKVFPLDPAWDEPAVLDRYRRIATLDHPDILPIYALETIDGVVYLVIRYVPGGDLATSLAADGPLPVARAARLVSQIASGLDAAHAAGIVHGDVKPSNILLGEGGRVFLADFSPIAPGTRDPAGAGQVLGTIDYMAPEIATGGPVDGRADIYALGCVLFECLTGRVPFAAPDAIGVLWAHQHELPPSAVALRPDLDASVDAVLAKAMAKAPGDRFASATEFAWDFNTSFIHNVRSASPPASILSAEPIRPTSRPTSAGRIPRPVETSITTAVHETLLEQVDAVGTLVELRSPPVRPVAPPVPRVLRRCRHCTPLATPASPPAPKASPGLGRITTWFGRGRGAPAPPAMPPGEVPARAASSPTSTGQRSPRRWRPSSQRPARPTPRSIRRCPLAPTSISTGPATPSTALCMPRRRSCLPAPSWSRSGRISWTRLRKPSAWRTVDPDARLRIFKTLEVRSREAPDSSST